MSEHGEASLTCPVKGSPTFVTELSGGSDQKTREAVRVALGMEGDWQLALPPCVRHSVRVHKHVHVKEQTCV